MVCWIVSVLAIGISVWLEIFNDVRPCTLCKLQRIPYLVICLFAPFGCHFKFCRIAKFLVIVCFSALLILSSVHLAIQNGIVSDFCAVPKIHSAEEFHKILAGADSCAKVSWKLFGISMAGYNFFLSLLFLMLSKRALSITSV